MLDAESVLPTLSPWERGEKTRAEMAAELGISVQWLRKLLARERERQADGTDKHPAHELPWVPLSYVRLPTHHYRLDHDADSDLPSGPFRIGDSRGNLRVQRSSNGVHVEAKPPKSKAKFKPKRPRKGR